MPGEEPLFRLSCPPESSEEDPPGRTAIVALFRDLNETVYLAACPLIEPGKDDQTLGAEEERPLSDELIDRLCADIEPGRTFTAETDRDAELRIVNRGRQLRLRLFETLPRGRDVSSSYDPKPSKGSLGPAGRATRSRAADAPNPPESKFEPHLAENAARSGTRLASKSSHDPGPARTGLGAGAVAVRCPRGADVWIDGAHLGACPIRMPLSAGRHEIVVMRGERTIASKEIRLEAGQSLSLRLPD